MVKQRNKGDCGIAAVANATGRSYAEVKRRFGRFEHRGGMDLIELDWLVNEFGEWRKTHPPTRPTVSEWLRRRRSGRYVLLLASLLEGHAIAVVDGTPIGDFNENWPIATYWKQKS